MRVRKKSWTQNVLTEAIEKGYLVDQPQNYKGQWKKTLNTNILHVEIGAGKGDYYLGMANLYPNQGWISIERVSDVAAYAMRKVLEAPVENGRFINLDAQVLEEWFEEGEIDVIHLNFSDPWPKKAHNKRRLTTNDFALKYEQLLSDLGQIQLKSDNRVFFEDSVVMLSKVFELEELWVDFRSEAHDEDVITEYEQRFIDLNQPIYRAIWRKK